MSWKIFQGPKPDILSDVYKNIKVGNLLRSEKNEKELKKIWGGFGPHVAVLKDHSWQD